MRVVWGVTMDLAWTAESGASPPTAEGPVGGVRSLADAWQGADATAGADRQTAMRELYHRCHADMVRFAAFLTGDATGAEDVAHDAFAKVFDAWDRVADTDRLDAYLKATVVNVVRGSHRRRQVAERSPSPTLRAIPSAEDDAIAEFSRRRTLDAVATLPLRQRACVVMRHWMHMTESEIAEALDVSVGSVRTHVKRGMRTLERTLGAAS